MTEKPHAVVDNVHAAYYNPIFFFLSGVASLWRVCSSDLDYSQAAASSGLLILDEFLNGCFPQVRDQVLVGTQCSPGFV